jgi:signal recognition particle subunit SRP54
MFESLTEKLTTIFDKLRGRGVLTEEDLARSLREVRIALLEGDVALPVVKIIIERVREKALGKEVLKSITPCQMIVKFVHEELIESLGQDVVPLNLRANSPFSFLLVGLQGAGKTTSAAKLANLLKKTHKIMLVSLDLHRPAAREQLQILAKTIGVESLPIMENEKDVMAIVKRAFASAAKAGIDIIIFDTAGRTHINQEMMNEVKMLEREVKPTEILLVADAMTGQDAVNVARSFKEYASLSGLILTRVDGDARGGAAISMRHVTNCPIKFLGVGEGVDRLIPFDPKRIADQILDMGDIVELVERVSKVADEEKTQKMQARFETGRFNLNDMEEQLLQMLKMGGISGILKLLPGAKKIASAIGENSAALSEKTIHRQIALIRSMTPKERRNPDILNGSRRKRIAAGAGQSVVDLNRFLKQYQGVKDMAKKFSGKGMKGMGALRSLMRPPFG